MYSEENWIFSLLFGCVMCVILEYFLHYRIALNCGIAEKDGFTFLSKKCSLWKIMLTIFSTGYLFAHHYKGDINGRHRKRFIRKCNRCNLVVSLFLMSISFCMVSADYKFLIPFIMGINGYRFISRSLEIIVAFGFDAFDENDNKSELNKLERINLATTSYLEIYIYSASFYVTLIAGNSSIIPTWKAMLMTLSAGTLTNVAYTQDSLFEPLKLFPFFQVFATLSLIVLSLTMYVSREFIKKKKSKKHPFRSNFKSDKI